MEFPDLGKNCSETNCNKLDFLPITCDACKKIFCMDHVKYSSHNCDSAYKKDVQVPVCPLCNRPMPLRPGEQADVVVGAHIDRDCESDPARARRKIFTNKCNAKGCRGKEVVPMICKDCKLNFCLKHRHPTDHSCEGAAAARRKAAEAALSRHTRNTNTSTSSRPSQSHVMAVQGTLNEDEALARALAASMQADNSPTLNQGSRDRCALS